MHAVDNEVLDMYSQRPSYQQGIGVTCNGVLL